MVIISTGGKHFPLRIGTVSSLKSILSSNINCLSASKLSVIAFLRSSLVDNLKTSILDPSSAGFKKISLNGLNRSNIASSKLHLNSCKEGTEIQFGVEMLFSLKIFLKVSLFQVFFQILEHSVLFF